MTEVRSRKRSVRATLFSSYLLLIFVSGSFFTVFSYFYTAGVLRRMAIRSLRDLASTMTDALDAELQKMNYVSINVTFSGRFKQLVAERLAFSAVPESPEERTRKYLNSAEIVAVMQDIIGPFKPVPQVNFYDLRGEMVGAGVYSQSAPLSVFEVPWLSNLDRAVGTKRFSAPHTDALLGKTFPLYNGRSYVSLYRTSFDEYRVPIGVIEVKQFTETIFRSLAAQGIGIVVYSGGGDILYPVDPRASAPWPEAVRAAADGEILALEGRDNGGRRIATVSSCTESEWRILVSQEERTLLEPLNRFTRIVFSFSLVLFGAAVLLASRLARRLTTPLKAMHQAISGLDWDAVSAGARRPELESDLNELEQLQLAFKNMQAKLQQSMDEVLRARTHEIQATMLALQSQMDPHFIYNMLTTIGVMAEEGMREEISQSVEHLTHLLRYIASGKSSVVTIGEELEYARRYLACMKIRFRDKLAFDIRVPPSLLSLKVPKLIIQPIIENTMKYGTRGQPPWHVVIEGEDRDGRFWIRIQDDGPGFEPRRLAELTEDIRRSMSSSPDPALEISGMGLLNIASRLRLFYGEEAVYRLENIETGGARVVIGGTREPKAQL